MKYLFLDSNIYLHYIGYEDIPWQKLLNTNDEITIVLPGIVVREIDRHKDSSKGRIRDKARKISAKFKKVLLDEQQGRIPLVHLLDIPATTDQLKKYDLTVNDDRIIIAALNSDFPIDEIYIVSNDTDILLKAKEANIMILSMDDTYRCSEEPTEEEKELRQVKAQIDRISNRAPNPIIRFTEQAEDTLVLERKQYKSIEEVTENIVSEELKKYPKKGIIENNRDNDLQNDLSKQLMRTLSVYGYTSNEAYNNSVDAYEESFRQKTKLKLLKVLRDETFKKLSLDIANLGTSQCGDIFIEIKFPDNINIYTKEDSYIDFEYKNPIEPNESTTGLPINHYISALSNNSNDYSYICIWDPQKTLQQKIFKKGTKGLIHGLSETILSDLYINTQEVQDFEIEWLIADSELLDHKTGKLRVIVK